MLIIFPHLLLTINLAASFERRKTALSCVSMTLSQSSDFSFNTPPLNETLPALFTRMPMPPSSLSTLLSAGSSPARLVTSTLTATDGTPIFFNSESTRWFFSSFRPNTATAAPASANPSAMLRPIPPLPPVTTATRPVRSNSAGVVIKHSPYRFFGLAAQLLIRRPDKLDSKRNCVWCTAAEPRDGNDFLCVQQLSATLNPTGQSFNPAAFVGYGFAILGETVVEVPVVGISDTSCETRCRKSATSSYRNMTKTLGFETPAS